MALLIPYFAAAASGHLRPAVLLAIGLSGSAGFWRTVVEHEPLVLVAVAEVQSLTIVGLVLAVGEAAWQRRRWAQEVRDRLARAADDARRETSRLMAEQRLAVSADLHDVAAHSLVVIGIQLRLPEETVTADPAACRQAIAAALAAHDDALRETTTTVRLLRADGPDHAAPRTPVPGLADLHRLREMAAAADLDLEVRVDTDTPPPAATALVTYRICQEALNNTIKHANARHAVLSVDASADELHLSFRDDGTNSPPDTGATVGHGLAGMAERARSLGRRCAPATHPTTDSSSKRGCPPHPERSNEDPGPIGRRPAACPRRAARVAGAHRRHHHRGRGPRRRAGGRADHAPAPHLVLMDIRMPAMDGITATRTILGQHADARTRVIVLTTFDLDEYVFAALRAGASVWGASSASGL